MTEVLIEKSRNGTFVASSPIGEVCPRGRSMTGQRFNQLFLYVLGLIAALVISFAAGAVYVGLNGHRSKKDIIFEYEVRCLESNYIFFQELKPLLRYERYCCQGLDLYGTLPDEASMGKLRLAVSKALGSDHVDRVCAHVEVATAKADKN